MLSFHRVNSTAGVEKEEMRILGLDIGEKRIGVAISDESGYLARGLGTIERNQEAPLRIKELLEKYQVEKIVFGLPLKLDGSMSPQTERTLAFVEKLKALIQVPFVPWDERLTSKEAEFILLEADLSRKKRKKLIDKLSAQIILQGYLNNQNPAPPEET